MQTDELHTDVQTDRQVPTLHSQPGEFHLSILKMPTAFNAMLKEFLSYIHDLSEIFRNSSRLQNELLNRPASFNPFLIVPWKL